MKKVMSLSKSTKRIMSTILDKTERGIFKRIMMDAEFTKANPPKSKKEEKGEQ
jgi:hypothetical protein